ncbi:endonuclease/exonuclease/phosphatase family protein [Cellulophaga baltica]|uniref:endonuclease/exonuclease/phosphatase family protein n=1 Tax=Cellulophaga TaxID=104264 RepID=UPI001C06D8B4|nr:MULTISPECIES: endonuclease/exonuclease/phosphatase family protein [Cellulophaga]MBU2996497.1 endonuclease/exonuclease/phosphatase family protein [Cellulophaga baltica]MDO6767891.1 endonuclease/exonuclease/phosphatase family protein [Cellulophaga sp. 1_MG-2023]
MKKIKIFIKKFIFSVNVFFALCLLLSCFVPFISTAKYPFVAFLSLGIPILVFINIAFIIYWLFLRKKQFFFSFLILLISYFSLSSFYMFRLNETEESSKDLSIMSYNVRGFNDNLIHDSNLFNKIKKFIIQEDPDIICFQEFDYYRKNYFKEYKYSYHKHIKDREKVNMGVFSKYPIISNGLLSFPDSGNDGAYVDVLYKNDTVRIYSLHLESLRVSPHKDALVKEESSKLYGRLTKSFVKQQEQAELVLNHMKSVPYKTIVCGDFNSTEYSNIYKTIKGRMNDTFKEKGVGFGKTYNFKYYPARIDFILGDHRLKVKSHKNYDVEFSDHFPIMASFAF